MFNTMKLQRMLFLTACTYRYRTGGLLFAERFQPWPYGPVLLSVDRYFKPNDGEVIDGYAMNCRNEAVRITDESSSGALLYGVVYDV